MSVMKQTSARATSKMLPRCQKLVGTAMLASLLLANSPASAQSADLQQLRQNISLLTEVLEDALNLNESAGLFGIALGGVESTYLEGQGIVLEIRTPLANRRNRLSLATLSSTVQSLGARTNPFEAMRRSATPAPVELAPDDTATTAADSFYADMMERIASIDFSLVVNTAIQQAASSARSLRSLGEVDEADYQQMQARLDELRQRLQEGVTSLRELEAEIRQGEAAATARSSLNQQLDSLQASIEPLREEALALARQLQAENEAAQQRYASDWQQQFENLETSLYTALCDFGASLRALPADEKVSVILTGLGETAGDNRRTDRVHVLGKADILQCQSGAIDVASLRQRSSQYSY